MKRGFTEYFHIVNHIRVHNGGKPYTCTQCNKALIYKLGLKSQVISHSGEKPYQCYQCGKPFRQCVKNKILREATLERSPIVVVTATRLLYKEAVFYLMSLQKGFCN